MAQFDFCGTRADSQAWLGSILDLKRFSVIVGHVYSDPAPLQLESLASAPGGFLERTQLVYLWSSLYSRFPPHFGPPNSDGRMRIDVTRSGPALELSLPVGHQRPEAFGIGLGDLMYQPSYCDPGTGDWFAPPASLKDAYRELVAFLRRQMVKRYARSQVARNGEFRDTVETLWLGADAARLLDQDQAEILINGDWVRGATLTPDRTSLATQVDRGTT
jgi:hypothetical protein